MQEININELVSRTMIAMETRGLKPFTVWSRYGGTFLPIIKFHELEDKDVLDSEVLDRYVKLVETRFDNGEISLCVFVN